MKIVHYPHPALRHKSKLITRVDSELRSIVREMFDLMYAANGVGLAANQVDLPIRLFIVNLAASPEEGEELVFINPVISRPKGSAEQEEGCLSLPGLYGDVIRPKEVRVSAYTISGEPFQATLSGMFSRVVQHELDHLDGVLFPDRMTLTRQAKVKPVLEEFDAVFTSMRQRGEIPDDQAIAQRLAEWEQRYC